MSKLILTLICVFISVSITAETVYKKTNPDGSVEFTDTPSTDNEEFKIRKPSTYSPVRLPSSTLPTGKPSTNFNYTLTINQPANDTTIVNQADVQVSISIQPALLSGAGHHIRYQLADQSIVSQSTPEIFKNVARGTHNISVSIVDAKGNVVSPVASSIFHMKRFFKKAAP